MGFRNLLEQVRKCFCLHLSTYLLTSSPHFFFRDEYLAYKSALFFCINPASVLFLAPLTLTLLSAATFAAMASVESGMGLFTGTYLAMATAAQPSGVLNLLMVLYSSMRQVSTQTILFVKHKKEKKKSKQALYVRPKLIFFHITK